MVRAGRRYANLSDTNKMQGGIGSLLGILVDKRENGDQKSLRRSFCCGSQSAEASKPCQSGGGGWMRIDREQTEYSVHVGAFF